MLREIQLTHILQWNTININQGNTTERNFYEGI